MLLLVQTAASVQAFLRSGSSQRRRYTEALIGVLVDLARWDQRDRLPATAAALLPPPDLSRTELCRQRRTLERALRELPAT